MSTTLDDAPTPGRPSRHRGDRVRTAVRSVGEVLITVGMVLLLFVVYQVYWTDILSADKQQDVTSALDGEWAEGVDPLVAAPPVLAGQQRNSQYSVDLGAGFAKLHVPTFGSDYQFTVLEGTGEETLAVGPGHYTGTAFPGELGNFAVAGHRVGNGAPFNDLDLLESCDAVIAETATSWYVYRVLPMAEEVEGWAAGKGASDPRCLGTEGVDAPVAPLGGVYSSVVGREIVDPSRGDVIAAVPGDPTAAPAEGEMAALLTLTTCHPRFSARERMIIHAVLVKTWTKDGSAEGTLPPEMTAG